MLLNVQPDNQAGHQVNIHVENQVVDQLVPVPGLAGDRQPAAIYLAGLGRGSRATQWFGLVLVSKILTGGRCDPLTLPWWALRRQHVNAVRSWLIDHRSAATGRRTMAALRGTLRECWRLELMPVDAYMRAIDVKSIRGEKPSQAAGRALSDGEKRAIIEVCRADLSPAGPRDAAIFGLGVFGGLRRAEIAGLQLGDYDQPGGVLTVRGKGSKIRTVHLAPGVDRALEEWLQLRGLAAGPLFLTVNRWGGIGGAGISGAAVYDLVRKRSDAAGVESFSPHDMRRTFAGDLLDTGVDLATVQKIMGHASPATTAGYDRRGERAKRAAIARLNMAWV